MSRFSPANDFKVRIGKSLLKLSSQVRADHFRTLVGMDQLGETLTKADVLRAGTRTNAGRIFTVAVGNKLPFVFSNDQYIAWCRSFLGLPPVTTVGGHTEQKGFDYPVQRCQSMHVGASPFLDADGAHAAAHCPSAYGAQMKRHNNIARVLAEAAKRAGLKVDVEPATHGLLLGEFTKAECKRIFPKHVSKEYREKFAEVVAAAEAVAAPGCELTEEAKRALVRSKVDALPAPKAEDATGLRIDLALENATTGETWWVDVTAVHTGAESYQDKELKHLSSKNIAESISQATAMVDPLKLDQAPHF